MSPGDVAWVAEFSAIEGNSGKRHLRLTSNPPTWRPQLADSATQRVIFDGTLHDRAELERRLSIGNAKRINDADLVLAAYAKWGEDAWHRINGHFAILLWDQNRDRLFSLRDPLGAQPLFFAQTAGKLILSPCSRTLRLHPDVASDLNLPALVDYLARRWIKRDETCFEQIRRVLPGHVLNADQNESTVLRYWNPVPASGKIDWIPDAEVQERFEALLERSVVRSLKGGPAGIFFSGGLDSAAVATLAAELCSRDGMPAPQLFSFAVPKPFDETIVQRGLASRLGLKQQLLEFDEVIPAGTILASGVALSGTLPAPLVNGWAPIFQKFLLEAARRGCRVMMTGEGGDELLGVSPYVAADLLRVGNLRGLYRLWRSNANFYPEVRWASLPTLVTRYGVRPLLEQRWPVSRVAAALKRRKALNAQLATAAGSASWVVPESWIAPDPALRTAISTRLLTRHTQDSNRRNESAWVMDLRRQLGAPRSSLRVEESYVLSRQNGMAIHDPFWDKDLIELMIRVRPLRRQRDGMPKALIRENLIQRFPGLGFESQQKKVLGNLVRSTTRAEIKQALGTPGKNWVLDELGVIDSQQMIREMGNPKGTKASRIRDVLNLEAWVRANQ